MATISASMVKELRERTGLGMMECKKALVEAGGDIDAAIDHLRKSSGMKAAKKAGRVAADGVVRAKQGFLVEINSETDFVARDENFLAFANSVVDAVVSKGTTDVAAVVEGEIESAREALVQKIGENITVRRVAQVEGETVGDYVHGNNRIGVVVALKGGDEALARDVAMHIAAVNPQFVKGDDVPEDVLNKEKEIFTAQAQESGKPAEIIEKMIGGRIRKFVSEISLVDQPFVKDPDLTVGKLVANAGAEVLSFVRYEVGDGIEKEEIDFATEVMQQARGE